MTRAALVALALAACDPTVVDLGRVDAAVDAPHAPGDASLCRCRITPCRVPGDCALIGGACGADQYCVGAFGTCATDTECMATATDSVCTQSATSTLACATSALNR